MKKEEFLKTLYLKYEDLLENYDFQKLVLKDLIEIGFVYVHEHFNNSVNKFPNMMLQMSLMKAKSVLKLSEGEFFQNNSKSDKPYIDIQSISSVYRSLFENYCFFNHLYISDWSNEEFLLLENIWRITSLNQRRKMLHKNPLLKKSKGFEVVMKDMEEIKRLKAEIEKSYLFIKNEKSIRKYISKNIWQLTIRKNKVLYISWKEMYNRAIKNHNEEKKDYQRFSLDTHPTFFSVFQFGDLYKNRHDLQRRSTVMYETIRLLSKYLNDFEKLLEAKPKIEKDSKYLIEFFGNRNI
ncbi:hypothetical protein [Winogradskyella sp. MH6]|uniref:hypothetical protein n=1 Tax=Winogradskyella sp. MH6 TaxID=2929510 RepID=UPI001FB4CEE1|nr:hypothetical protein [Winogradskyella sp. MH6]